jgi:hypothetical protein
MPVKSMPRSELGCAFIDSLENEEPLNVMLVFEIKLQTQFP